MDNFITLNDVNFEIRRNPRRKHISVGLDARGTYYIAAPENTDKQTIVRLTKDIIAGFLAKTAERHRISGGNAHEYKEGELFYLRGEQYPLRYDLDRGPYKMEFYDRAFHARAGTPMEIMPHVFTHLYARELEKRLRGMFPALCKKVGAGPRRVSIKNVKTIWGSRTSNGSITMNVALALVSDALLEYVIIHELCHIFEMNHSEKFWALVEKYCPDCKQRRDELKRDGIKYKW